MKVATVAARWLFERRAVDVAMIANIVALKKYLAVSTPVVVR